MRTTCRTDGCHRAPRPDSPYCETCFDRLIYAGNVPRAPLATRRINHRPLAEITESELRLLWGDR
jgi:hypothetical protein